MGPKIRKELVKNVSRKGEKARQERLQKVDTDYARIYARKVARTYKRKYATKEVVN